MRIGIDARMYGPTVGGGGLGRYVEQLIIGLQKYNTEHRFVLFLKKENFKDCHITNPLFEKRLADIHWYSWKEQTLLPIIFAKEHLDLIHFPHWNVPLFCKIPFFVTIHDLILLQEPKSAKITTRSPWNFWIKYLGYKIVLNNTIKRSKKIIAVSNYTKTAIEQFFPQTEKKKISVVYEGLTFFKKQLSVALPQQIIDPYLLYIGNAYPHKNLEKLLQAFVIFSEKHQSIQLVLAGKDDVFFQRLKQQKKKLNITEDRIVFIPTPSDALVQTLYQHALIYVFPSKVEGFGLPPLEAMSYGVPVVSSQSSCLPEILEEAALYIDPTNEKDIAQTLDKLLQNSNLQKQLITKGLEQSKKYSWETMAKQLLYLYGGKKT